MKLGIASSMVVVGLLTGTPQAQVSPREQAQKPPGSSEKVTLHSRLVSLTVSVMDGSGRFVTGLKKEHFEVFDNGVKQEIAHFTDEDGPASIGVIYDVSGSMHGLTPESFSKLRRFFEVSHEDDEFFLVAFNDKANLVQDFTVSPERVLSPAMMVAAKGNTALYDAVYLGIEKVKQGRHAKKALLIISDGLENNSRYSFKELRERLVEADVQVYAIGIGRWAPAGSLGRITELAGGTVFFPFSEFETADVYTRVALALRHQYVIGFYPSDTASGAGWHKLDVKIKAPKGLGRLVLAHKKGYQPFSR